MMLPKKQIQKLKIQLLERIIEVIPVIITSQLLLEIIKKKKKTN